MLTNIKPLQKIKMNKFIYRLMIFFLVIISIYSAFQFAAYNFYIRSIDSEIVKYYSASLKNTSSRLDGIIGQIETTLLSMHLKGEFQPLKSGNPMNAYEMKDICEKVLLPAVKNNTYLDNIILYSLDSDIVLTAYGSHLKSFFFNSVYSSSQYTLEYWEKLYLEDFTFRYIPCIDFISRDLSSEESKLLMPVIFKPDSKNSIVIVAFLDITYMLKEIDPQSGEDIYIYKDGALIFSGSRHAVPNTLDLNEFTEYTMHDGRYYFKQENRTKGITYLKAVSFEVIRRNSKRVNLLFICIIVISIIVGFAVSVMLSVKINNPIKQLMLIINSGQPYSGFKSNISELEFINNSIQKMIIQNNRYDRDQDTKNSLLKKYFYQTGLKNIRTEMSEIKDFFMNQNVFSLVYFVVHYKKYFIEQFGQHHNNATFFLTEYIQKIVEGQGIDSLTFQIEDNQIITIINYSSRKLNVRGLVDGIVKQLENEQEYLFLTIAVGKVYSDISYLNTAYSEVFNISQQQRLCSDMQVLTPDDMTGENNRFYFTDEQEQAFFNNVRNGNTQECINLVSQILEGNYSKDVRLFYFQKLGVQLVNICVKAYSALSMNLPGNVNINDVYDKINRCYTLDEFKSLFSSLLGELTLPIRNNKRDGDYIIDYVMQYIEKHYMEDIYLDLLSDKLNITSSYLSQYFKSKTGVNFLDYLNAARLTKAKEMLIRSTNRIDTISQHAGYKSTASFIRSFKKFFGLTPGEFRREHLQK